MLYFELWLSSKSKIHASIISRYPWKISESRIEFVAIDQNLEAAAAQIAECYNSRALHRVRETSLWEVSTECLQHGCWDLQTKQRPVLTTVTHLNMLTEQYVLATNSAEIIFGRSKDITTNSRVQLRPVFFRTGSLPRNAISESLLDSLWQISINVKVCKTTR